MLFIRQVWALASKDLLIFRRRWMSTSFRAVILPIIYTFCLVYIKFWTASPVDDGIGAPTSILDLASALSQSASSRPRVVIANNGFTDGDIGQVVSQLSSIIQSTGKELHVVHNTSDIIDLCPSSNSGVTGCFGAVLFQGSPDHGDSNGWNYTLFFDEALGGGINVNSASNDVQVYVLPFQNAIDSLISDATKGASKLPETMLQYPFTAQTDEEVESQNNREYEGLVVYILGFAFFIGLVGIVYHCVGHIVNQRERGMLQLMDAMMPNRHKWHCIAIRILAAHAAFDITYLPSWIAMGALMTRAFPNTNAGDLIGLHILAGLALTSYSILVSSLFHRTHLSSIVATVAAVCFALVAQFGEGENLYATLTGVLATAILFPPATYVYFLIIVGIYETQDQGINLSATVPPDSELYWWVQPSTFLGVFVFQIVLYPILGAILEHFLHGTDSSGRQVFINDAMSGCAVRLEDFSKDFKSRVKKGGTVHAVNNLNMEIPNGSITVLLGANGSGKTTTLSAIAGLQKVSRGSIKIDGGNGIGICPQKNIIWDELTVQEHVELFGLMKATTSQPRQERRAEADRLVEGCDLNNKKHARAKTLSGGQKRKLQLAMMFAGGSRVCCIDEATSGIDPLARSKIWDILLAERGRRSLLFTTHFLDEAEVLSDQVVILSKGVLKAQGSVAALKAQLGGGFKVLLGENSKDINVQTPPEITRSSDYNRAVFEAPDSAGLASLIRTLERSGVPGATKYTIQGPSVEEIFLKLSDEMQGDSELARELGLTAQDQQIQADQSAAITHPATPESRTVEQDNDGDRGFILTTGVGCSPFRQTIVLFQKRMTILKHNYMPYVAALFVPLVLAGLVTRFMIGYTFTDGIPCSNGNSQSDDMRYFSTQQGLNSLQLVQGGFVYGPVNRLPLSALEKAVPNITSQYETPPTQSDWQGIPTTNSSGDFSSFISSHRQSLYVGGFYDDSTNPVIAWSGGQGFYYPAMLKSLADGVLINQTINLNIQGFSPTFTPANGPTAFVALFTVLGFAVYPGFFALYPTGERLRRVRAMQYSNGILSSSLWIAYAMFDLIFITLVSVLTVVIWTTQWSGWYGLGYMFVVFFLYGLAATAFSYAVSLVVSSQLAAFSLTAIVQLIIALLYFVGYAITAVQAPPNEVYTWFNYIHYTIALISPIASLYRALFMVLNNYSLACQGFALAPYPGAISIYGAPILYLIVQFILLCAFLVFWESDRSLEVFGIHWKRSKAKSRDIEKDQLKTSISSDASEDAEHLAETNDGLRVFHLSKSFGSTQAVDDVTFGILPSEKFALLGPNGAGKSTTISLVRGDLKLDRRTPGSIYIGKNSLEHAPVAAKQSLGTCPQFDATDSMTLREHLNFYARARGVPDPQANIKELIDRLGLQPHADKLVKKLSGGTHRKLSLAIALLANPRVLLLDEPSSGMDPAAKRALWRTLRQTAAGRVLLLTTHSMEEAAALCDRAGILASQLLALGTIDQLKRRHGPAACVQLVHRDSPHASEETTTSLRNWVVANFPDAEVEKRAFGGQVRFNIPRTAGEEGDGVVGHLFQKVEAAREELGVVDYSIGPATLDQVFLAVIKAHGVEEEDSQQVHRFHWPWRKQTRVKN